MVILLLVASLGARLLLISLQSADKNPIIRANHERIRQELVKFVEKFGRLPCPAIPSYAIGNYLAGSEAPAPGTCTGSNRVPSGSPTTAIGIVPWTALGLTPQDVTDSYGRYYTYYVALAETNRTMRSVAKMSGTITVHSAAPTSLGLTPTGNQINACSTTAGDNSCNATAAAAVISHGVNGLGGYLPNGQRSPLPTSSSPAELQNVSGNTALVRQTAISSSTSTFDDIVTAWAPADLIGKAPLVVDLKAPLYSEGATTIQRLNQISGALLTYIYVTTNTGRAGSLCQTTPAVTPYCHILPFADSLCTAGNQQNTQVSGCVPYTTIGLPSTVAVDEWGNNIKYVVGGGTGVGNSARLGYMTGTGNRRGIALNNTNLAGVTTAYSITSNGPDGIAGTADDIAISMPLSNLITLLTTAGVSLP
jgi:hypothetical protein